MGAPDGFIDVVAALNPIAADDSETPAHWSVTFGVDDADATAAKARELGGEVVAGPVDAPWARMAVIKDPQGATFIASQFVPRTRTSRLSSAAPRWPPSTSSIATTCGLDVALTRRQLLRDDAARILLSSLSWRSIRRGRSDRGS